MEEEAEDGDEHEQEREDRQEAVIGDQGGEVAAPIIAVLLDHSEDEGRGRVPLLASDRRRAAPDRGRPCHQLSPNTESGNRIRSGRPVSSSGRDVRILRRGRFELGERRGVLGRGCGAVVEHDRAMRGARRADERRDREHVVGIGGTLEPAERMTGCRPPPTSAGDT